jgi:hypothetical protein
VLVAQRTMSTPLTASRGVSTCVISRPNFGVSDHGSPAFYQMEKMITVSGTVTKFTFVYSHPQLYFDARDERASTALSMTPRTCSLTGGTPG